MSETHTPGPWSVQDGARCFHVVSADTLFQTSCISFDGRGEANAHLVSAAPELLFVATVINNDVKRGEPCPICGNAPHGDNCGLVAALAKASGAQP